MTDEKWFESLWQTHSSDVWAFAARRVPAVEADDIVAETFLIAWRQRAERGRKPWLLAVAHNVIGTRYRSRDRQERLISRLATAPASQGANPIDGIDLRQPLREALRELNVDELEAILLVGWDDLSPKDAASVAGCSRTAMRMRLLRARRQLSQSLAPLQRTIEERTS